MRVTRLASLGMVAVVGLVASGHLVASDPGPFVRNDTISGTWRLAPEASDDVGSVMSAVEGQRGGGGAARRGGAVAGGQPPAGGRMMVRGQVLATIRSLADLPERLTIEQEDGLVRFRTPDGGAVQVPVDGTSVTTSWFDGEETDVQGEWMDGTLHLTRRREWVTATDQIHRDPDSSRLVVTSRIIGGMGTEVSLIRYYDPKSES